MAKYQKGVLKGYDIPTRPSKEQFAAEAKAKSLADSVLRAVKAKRAAQKRNKRNACSVKLAKANPMLSEADKYYQSRSSSEALDIPKGKIKACQGGSCTPK